MPLPWLVSASDKLHNARAILGDFRAEGLGVFERFNLEAGVDGTIGYYRWLGHCLSESAHTGRLRDPRLCVSSTNSIGPLPHSEKEVGVSGRWPQRTV
jgi:hypothetical protein